MHRLLLASLLLLALSCQAQFINPMGNNPGIRIPKFNEAVDKLYGNLRGFQWPTPPVVPEDPQPFPETPVTPDEPQPTPVTPVAPEDPQPVAPVVPEKPKVESPNPQCLSQTYQTLNLLYSFGADAMAQDIQQLKSDFGSLTPLIQKINNFCTPKVVIEDEINLDSEECTSTVDQISQVIKDFQQGDTNNYINIINTVQNLGAMEGNFTRDCSNELTQNGAVRISA